MHRRQFLALAAATTLSTFAFADQLPTDVKITRITAFDLTSKRVKLVGKNARLGIHGDRARDRIIILHTNTGHQGIGYCRADQKDVAKLLNQNPRDLFDGKSTRIKSALAAQTSPIWDLLGKLANKPVYELLSPSPTNEKVPVYDGSVYFSDLLDDYASNWQDRFKWEIDEILSRGHRAFKVKIGRGHKWMDPNQGDQRDIDVLKLIRGHAGKEIAIGVDANNGYDLPRTKHLLSTLADFNFAFIEEMFPENIERYRELKDFLKTNKIQTLIADGETQPNIEPLIPFFPSKTIDIYQLDVNQVGIDGLLDEAQLVAPHGGTIAPHVWGTHIGFYAQLHVARAFPNWYSGEQDPLSSPALIADGYTIKDGQATVPDSPGFGLKLDLHSTDLKPAYDMNA